MLDDVVDAVEYGKPSAAGCLAIAREDGTLVWTLPDRRTRPHVAAARPANRFGLIDAALEPVTTIDPARLAQLKLDLAVVMSAEALFNLMDLCGLGPDAAVASAVTTARTLTTAAVT